MRLPTVASVALALAWTACAAAADDFKDSPYYPMQVGAVWNYKAGDSKFTVKVTTHEKVGTTMCTRLETAQEGKVIGSEDVFAKEDGVYRLALDGKVIEPAVCILKLPPKPGDGWSVDSKAQGKTGGTEALKGRFKVGGEEVTVPAGKYTAVTVSCDDLDANGAKYSFTTDYVKDVGMVKQVIEAGGLKVVVELEKYEPAAK